MNVALDRIQQHGQPDLADALKKFTETVLASGDLTPEVKKGAVEHLDFLIKQASIPKTDRQGAMAMSVMAGLEKLVNVSVSLFDIWNNVKANSLFFS
jgi:hypothetical protein